MKKALIVVTNIAKYDNLERPTGAWFLRGYALCERFL